MNSNSSKFHRSGGEDGKAASLGNQNEGNHSKTSSTEALEERAASPGDGKQRGEESASTTSNTAAGVAAAAAGVDLYGLAEAACQQIVTEERKNRKRHLDAIYARRRRRREKEEEAALQERCDALVKENSDLQKEEKRLLEMLVDARAKAAIEEVKDAHQKAAASAAAAAAACGLRGVGVPPLTTTTATATTASAVPVAINTNANVPAITSSAIAALLQGRTSNSLENELKDLQARISSSSSSSSSSSAVSTAAVNNLLRSLQNRTNFANAAVTSNTSSDLIALLTRQQQQLAAQAPAASSPAIPQGNDVALRQHLHILLNNRAASQMTSAGGSATNGGVPLPVAKRQDVAGLAGGAAPVHASPATASFVTTTAASATSNGKNDSSLVSALRRQKLLQQQQQQQQQQRPQQQSQASGNAPDAKPRAIIPETMMMIPTHHGGSSADRSSGGPPLAASKVQDLKKPPPTSASPSGPMKKAISNRYEQIHPKKSKMAGSDKMVVDDEDEQDQKQPASNKTSANTGGSTINDTPCSQDDFLRRTLLTYCLEKIPTKERLAFNDAMKTNPYLVQKESDPARYVRLESGDLPSAADRLVSYWKFRKDLFGADRALQPMDLSGNGAMDECDIALLEQGHLSFLPQAQSDKMALFFDTGENSSANAKEGQQEGQPESSIRHLRCLFYMLCVASESDLPLTILRLWRTLRWEKGEASQELELIRSIPLKTDALVCLYSPPSGAGRLFQTTVMPLYEAFYTGLNLPCRYHGYVGESPKEFAEALQKYGCSLNGLPAELGGVWSASASKQWFHSRRMRDREGSVETRVTEEEVMTPEDDTARTYTGKAAKDQECHAASSCADKSTNVEVEMPSCGSGKDVVEERKARKRKMDAVYARNRRKREKEEEDSLREKCHELSKSNLALKQEERRLLKLLVDAKASAAALDVEEAARAPHLLAQFSGANIASANAPSALMPSSAAPSAVDGNARVLEMLSQLRNAHQSTQAPAPSATMALLRERLAAELRGNQFHYLPSNQLRNSVSIPTRDQAQALPHVTGANGELRNAVLRAYLEKQAGQFSNATQSSFGTGQLSALQLQQLLESPPGGLQQGQIDASKNNQVPPSDTLAMLQNALASASLPGASNICLNQLFADIQQNRGALGNQGLSAQHILAAALSAAKNR